MYLTGFADEASQDFDKQLEATKKLGLECYRVKKYQR